MDAIAHLGENHSSTAGRTLAEPRARCSLSGQVSVPGEQAPTVCTYAYTWRNGMLTCASLYSRQQTHQRTLNFDKLERQVETSSLSYEHTQCV